MLAVATIFAGMLGGALVSDFGVGKLFVFRSFRHARRPAQRL